ncbi:MAG: sugar-binding protein [bacterium]
MRTVCIIFLLASLTIFGQEVSGPVKIYDTVYDKVDPGPPFQEAPRQLEEWLPPPPSSKEKNAGFIPYTRPEPFDIKPWSKPKPEERLLRLNHSLAIGEITCLWFALYALEPLSNLNIKIKPLNRGKTPEIQARYAHFWAQRTDWRGRTYYITPELLLPLSNGYALFPSKGGTLEKRALNIPQGESRLFWLTLRAPNDLPSGDYNFLLQIQAKGKSPLTFPISLHIYPFQLVKPDDKRWLLYSDSWLWGNLPDGEVLQILRDVKEHGVDGFTELPFGKLDLSDLKEGIVRYDPSPLLRLNKLMKEVGFKGPHTIGVWAEGECAQALGLQVDFNKEWPEELKEAVRKVAKCVVDTLKPTNLDWLFYGWDEPGPENLAALQQYRCWHEGGARTYVTFYQRETYDIAGQWMTAPCFSVGLIANEETAKWVRHQCDVRRQKFFWYGSGCYLGQEGRIFPNRYLTGWLFWKTKADAQVSWTFVRPHEDPFNDFDGTNVNNVEPKDQCTAYPWLARPNDYKSLLEIIPTIQWEAIREGINDYQYAYTLNKMVEEVRKKAKGKNKEYLEKLAKEGEETLKAVEESIPWGNEVGKRRYTNKELQEARTLLGKEIERLALALKGRRKVSKSDERDVKLHIILLPPEMADISREVPLPVVSIPKLASSPKIDGNIGEKEWADASIVSAFFDSETGKPMPQNIGTKAYLGYDDEALYVGFLCEGETKRIKAERWDRDSDGVWQGEGVEVFLASGDEPTRYTHIIVNAVGSILDEIVFDRSWNPQIQLGTRVEKDKWSLEMRIPWSVLPFAKTSQLRLNLCRNHSLINEETSHWAWSPTFGWFHNPSRFGFAKLTTSPIIFREIQPPTLYGDEHLIVRIFNKGNHSEKVVMNGKTVEVPAEREVQARIKVHSTIGKHIYKLNLRWNGQEEGWQIPYSIPTPFKTFSKVIIANEKGEAFLAIALSLNEELKKKGGLVLEMGKHRYRLPLNEKERIIRFPIRSSGEEIRLYLSFLPRESVKIRLFSPP